MGEIKMNIKFIVDGDNRRIRQQDMKT